MQDQERFRSTLLQWCYTSYGEVNCFLEIIEILLSWLALTMWTCSFKLLILTVCFSFNQRINLRSFAVEFLIIFCIIILLMYSYWHFMSSYAFHIYKCHNVMREDIIRTLAECSGKWLNTCVNPLDKGEGCLAATRNFWCIRKRRRYHRSIGSWIDVAWRIIEGGNNLNNGKYFWKTGFRLEKFIN